MISLQKYEDIYNEILKRDRYLEPLVNRTREVTRKYYKSNKSLMDNYKTSEELKEELIFYLLNKTLIAIIQYCDDYNLLIQDVFCAAYNVIVEVVWSEDLSKCKNIHSTVVGKVCRGIEKEFSLRKDEDIEFIRLQTAENFMNKYQYFTNELEDNLIQKIDAETIQKILSGLTEREQKVIDCRFGFSCDPMTLEQVGRIFNLSRDRIRQIEAKALRKLRHPSRLRQLNYYFDLFGHSGTSRRKEFSFTRKPRWEREENESRFESNSAFKKTENSSSKFSTMASDFDGDDIKLNNSSQYLLYTNSEFKELYKHWDQNKINAFCSLLQSSSGDRVANTLLAKTMISSNFLCQYFPSIFSEKDFVAIVDLVLEANFGYCKYHEIVKELFELSEEYFSLIYKENYESLSKFEKYLYFIKHFLLVFNSIKFKTISIRQIKEGYKSEPESYERFNYDKFIEIFNKYCDICEIPHHKITEFAQLHFSMEIAYKLYANHIKTYNELMKYSNLRFQSITGITSEQAFQLYQFLNSLNIM